MGSGILSFLAIFGRVGRLLRRAVQREILDGERIEVALRSPPHTPSLSPQKESLKLKCRSGLLAFSLIEAFSAGAEV